jgi:hypothetical protein
MDGAAMTWQEANRERVRGWIEDSLNVSLGLNDSSPDTLIAQAQALGLTPEQLRLWTYEQPKIDWSPGALETWARHMGFVFDTPDVAEKAAFARRVGEMLDGEGTK